MKKIFIFGTGDFAKLMLHYFNSDSSFKVEGFCVDKEYLKDNTFCNLPVVPFEDIQLFYPSKEYEAFIAVGYKNMRNRKIFYEKVKNKNYVCVNYISSKAISDNSLIIGENNVVLENVVIEPFVKIGNNNIIWSSSNICHNVNILSHCFIASKSLIGGFSRIYNNCFLGFNSTVIQHIIVEEETLIGANSLILKDTRRYTEYFGTPAREISNHMDEGIKLK